MVSGISRVISVIVLGLALQYTHSPGPGGEFLSETLKAQLGDRVHPITRQKDLAHAVGVLQVLNTARRHLWN